MKNAWVKWKSLAERIGDFQFNLIFSLLYFVFVVPFGLVSNFFSDFLGLKGFPRWERVDRDFGSVKSLKEQ